MMLKSKSLQIFFFLLLAYNAFGEANLNDLTAIVIITKHAEKGVDTSYPSDPYLNNEKAFPNGLDKLTNNGKADCIALGKSIKEKYGSHLKSAEDLVGIVDDRAFNIETAENVLSGIFGWSSSFGLSIESSPNNRGLLSGPEKCFQLRQRTKKALRSSQVQNLYNENRQLIQNITESSKRDVNLIQNVPVVYEAIETELNNYLKQPSWLSPAAVNKLKEITKELDKILYSNELITQLQLGQLLGLIRINFIDNTLQVPNLRQSKQKLAYMYVVGSDQFSALLNVLEIYEKRPKFASSVAIELDEQANIRVNYYDAEKRVFIEKQVSCDDKLDGCKLVPFLQKLDKNIPIDVKRSCILPRPRLIDPDYSDVLNKTNQAEEEETTNHSGEMTTQKPESDRSRRRDKSKDRRKKENDWIDDEPSREEDNEKDDDDTDLRRSQRRKRRQQKIKDYVKKKFDEIINKNRELISWLSDFFVRRSQEKGIWHKRNIENELRDRLIEVLQEKVKRIEDPKQQEVLSELLNKFRAGQEQNDKKATNRKSLKETVIENFENRIKDAIREKELTKQRQIEQLNALIEKIKAFSEKNALQRAERLEKLQEKINNTIREAKIKLDEKLDSLRVSVSDLLEDKFSQLKNNFSPEKLKSTLYEIENKLTNTIEDYKLKREERLNTIRNLMNSLVQANDLIESDREAKLKELKEKVSNLDRADLKTAGSSLYKSIEYSEVTKLIDQIPNQNATDSAIDEAVNNELLKVEKIKDKLKAIESNILTYLEKNKDNEKQINEDIAEFNRYLQSDKKMSVGILTRLARLVDDEKIKEELKETIKNIINFVKQSKQNVLTVETDLTTLIDEIEDVNKTVSNQQFDLNAYQASLNKTTPKILKAENPATDSEPALSPKAFGITMAIVLGTILVIAVTCILFRKYQKRKNYTRV